MGYYTTFEGAISSRLGSFSDEHIEELRATIEDVFYGDVTVDHDSISFNYLNGKYYGFEDEVRSIVDKLAAQGYLLRGEIVAYGEESPDIWRLVIRDNKVVRENPKLVWPDGTEQECTR